jgi:hypothetical protein
MTAAGDLPHAGRGLYISGIVIVYKQIRMLIEAKKEPKFYRYFR